MRVARRRKYKSKNKLQTFLRILSLVAALAVLAGICYGAWQLILNSVKLTISDALSFTRSEQHAFTGSGFYYLRANTLHYTDLKDSEKNTSIKLNTDDVTLVASEKIAAVYTGRAVQIINANNLIDAGGEVISLAVGQTLVAAQTDGAINVYNSNGVLVDSIQTEDQIMFCGFTTVNEIETLYAVTLNDASITPISTLTTYTYENNTPAMSGVITLRGQLIEEVHFTSKSIFIIGTADVFRYSIGAGAESWHILVYGHKPTGFSKSSRPLFTFVSRDGDDKTMRLLSVAEEDVANETVRDINLADDVHSCFAIGGEILAFTETEVRFHSRTGTQTDVKTLEGVCTMAQKLSETQVMVELNGKLHILTL